MKISELKNLSILYKVIIPVIIFNLLSILIFKVYFKKEVISKEIQKNIETTSSEVKQNYEHWIAGMKEKTLVTASVIAANPEIKRSYENFYRTYETDSCAKIISKTLSKITSSLEQNIHTNVRIHLHMPPGISLYRSWSSISGDDITYRQVVSELYSSQMPFSVVELNETGLVINSAFPVVDDENTLFGGIEITAPLNEVTKNLTTDKNAISSIFLLKNNVSLLNKTGSSNENNTIYKDFIITNEDLTGLQTNLLSNDTLLKSTLKPTYFLTKNYGFVLLPILNIKNSPLGVLVYQTNLTDIISYYSSVENIITFILTGILLITLAILIISLRKAIIIPFKQILKILDGMARGEHNRRIKIKTNDEIGIIKRSVNHLNENLINIENFAHEIGEGRFSAVFNPRSKKDSLAYTLLDMRTKLQNAREEEEKRRQEEKKREWQINGVSVINDILRQYNHSGSDLFYHVIGTLVKYIKANQGGLYLLDESEEYLELKGCYAYDRNKYLTKKIHIKEGLIGRCFMEKEYLNITNIPESYLKIVSGVGEKSPDSLLLVPLIHDEKVKGVIELASFSKFERYEIEFVKGVCDQLSSALNDIEYSTKTNRLLQESKEKEQRLTQQDEEMRQNMEEMKATHEEFERREKELMKRIEELEKN